VHGLLLRLRDKGQHGARSGAQAGDDRDRRPRVSTYGRRRCGGRPPSASRARYEGARCQPAPFTAPFRRQGRRQGEGCASRPARCGDPRRVGRTNCATGRRRHHARAAAVVPGVDGSGRASLIPPVSVVGRDGCGVRRSGRDPRIEQEQPRTYTGLLDPILRKRSPRPTALKPALFSANLRGRRPNCNGAGVIYTGLAIDGRRRHTCEVCEGKRFEASGWQKLARAGTSARWMAMSVTEAASLRSRRGAQAGQPMQSSAGSPKSARILPSASRLPHCPGGANGQRLKLPPHGREAACSLVRRRTDQRRNSPTSSSCSVRLDRLVDSGKSVLVIEHNRRSGARRRDHRRGPGLARRRTDRLEGIPADLVAARSTLSGAPGASRKPGRRTLRRRGALRHPSWTQDSSSNSCGGGGIETRPHRPTRCWSAAPKVALTCGRSPTT